MNIIELCGLQRTQKRREVFSTLNSEEVAALEASENAECLAKEFDRIILKLLRLIKNSTNKNNVELSKLDQDTNCLVQKFLNYCKNKLLTKKMENESKYFFGDICHFINGFVDDTYVSAVYNSIPRTSLLEFSKKSVGNQLFQVFYARNWGNEGICEGGSCSYWTILLYNFFNKLKEAGLNLKISFYRYKNLDDNIIGFSTQRHSGLIINFQGKDYIVERDGIIYDNSKRIVRDLQSYIDISNEGYKGKYTDFFENFKYENRKETDKVIFFDDINEFINHFEKYPPNYRFSCYIQTDNPDDVEYVNFEFGKISFWLDSTEYYLKDNNLSMNNLIENLVKKVFIKRTGNKIETITDKDREYLRIYFDLIKDKVNLKKLYEKFTLGGRWKARLDYLNGNPRISVCQIK